MHENLDGHQFRGQGINPDEFNRRPFTQFQTWLGDTEGAVGCPVNCRYCFFQLDGKTPTPPQMGLTPQELVKGITGSPTYHPYIPIHFGSQTDAFSTPETIKYYENVLDAYSQSELPNSLIFITKRLVPDHFINTAKNLTQKVLFYVSYSGLNGTGLEPNVVERHQRENFVNLHSAGLSAVHYWRPFFPQNSTDEVILPILDHVSKYADSSVAVGLRLNDGILKMVSPFWPELLSSNYDFQQTGEFWPVGVLDRLQEIAKSKYPNYPVYLTNTPCTISHKLGIPDVQGSRFDRMCEKSNCPEGQREICNSITGKPSQQTIKEVIESVGINPQIIKLFNDRLEIQQIVSTATLVYLRYILRFPVVSRDVSYEGGHNWANATGNESQDIIEVPWSGSKNYPHPKILNINAATIK